MLTTDLNNHRADVAVITETHCKIKHSASSTHIPGYSAFRKDRRGRKGEGVAVYVRTTMQSFEWVPPAFDSVFELLWVGVGATLVRGLYHPPRPQYSTESLHRGLRGGNPSTVSSGTHRTGW